MSSARFFIKQPKKADTLAEKTEKRTKKLLGQRLTHVSPHWLVSTGEILGLLIILAINFFLLLPFFGQEHQANGFSAPFIPLLAKLTSFVMPYAHGVRFWLLICLMFLPISLYFFIREISRRRLAAFAATLIISLPVGVFLPLRTRLGLFMDDGGQAASLTIILFSCLFLLRFLKGGNFKMAAATSLTMSLVALTSPLGSFILVCCALAITFSEMLLNQGRLKLLRLLTVLVFTAGLSTFWYHPSFVLAIINSEQGRLLIKAFANLLPISFFLVPLLGALGFLLFENKPQLQPLFLALLLSTGFGLLALGTGVQLSSASRFLIIFSVSLSFLSGIILTYVFDFFKTSTQFKKIKLLNRFQQQLSYISLGLFLGLIILIITGSGRSFRASGDMRVLGLETIKRTGVWEMRAKSGRTVSLVGSAISLFTAGLIVYLGKKVNKKT
ncbi:hypothetical protein KKD62_01445 [Patescibacteria group bacterium]|nr:hypothetical protein [Patescibacteria group bacterium]MBU1931387.1 hypothetical protein [Patescibacteria group bacterium]